MCFLLLGSLRGLDGLNEHGRDLEQVTADAIVGNLKDGGGVVLVDSDDAFGVLHTGQMLDGAGNAQGHVDLRVDGLAGLAHLVSVSDPASVNRLKR